MSYLKYTPFLYLIAAVIFIIDGITKINEPEGGYWLSFGIAAVAVFMFFFRRNFAKKIEERSKNRPPQ